MFQKLIDKSMRKSPWIYHINAGSCNGCDIELVSVLTPRYDAERFGFHLTGTPRQADIVVVSGPITMQSVDRLIRTLAHAHWRKCLSQNVSSAWGPARDQAMYSRGASRSPGRWRSTHMWMSPSADARPSRRLS